MNDVTRATLENWSIWLADQEGLGDVILDADAAKRLIRDLDAALAPALVFPRRFIGSRTCDLEEFSSRVCMYGTKGCVSWHKAPGKQQ